MGVNYTFLGGKLYWQGVSKTKKVKNPYSTATWNLLQYLLPQLSRLVRSKLEVESSRSSTRTHFKVLGLEGQVLGLEASSPQKLACLRLEDTIIF